MKCVVLPGCGWGRLGLCWGAAHDYLDDRLPARFRTLILVSFGGYFGFRTSGVSNESVVHAEAGPVPGLHLLHERSTASHPLNSTCSGTSKSAHRLCTRWW
jgi:hypothetical protein